MHHQKYPLGVSNTYMKIMWSLVIDYYLDTEVLYKRSSDAMFLRWLDGTEVKKKKKCSKKFTKGFLQLMLVDIWRPNT